MENIRTLNQQKSSNFNPMHLQDILKILVCCH